MSNRKSVRSSKRKEGRGARVVEKLNFDRETWQLEMKLRLPDVLELTGFNEARDVLGKVVQKLTKNAQVNTLLDLYKSEHAPLAKRLTFSFGFLLLFFGQFLLLKAPQFFAMFFALLAVSLLASRFLLYSLNGNIFYIFEFSTFNALLLALNATILSSNSVLWKVNFMTANGIVLWSTIPWRNSLTFSSLNSIASFVVHFLPAVVSYAERHMKPASGMYTYMCPSQMPEVASQKCRLSASEAIVYPISFCLVWNFAYVLLTEVLFRQRIYGSSDFNTSLKYAVENNTIILRQLTKLARKLKFIKKDEALDLEEKHNLTVALYTVGNVVLSIFFLSCSLAVFQNQILHTLYLFFFLAVLIWNGAVETYPDVSFPQARAERKASDAHDPIEGTSTLIEAED